jgi:hypothetical protein
VDINTFLAYVAALSVATERVTEFIKRLPWISRILSQPTTGQYEDFRVSAVHVLAAVIALVICHYFPPMGLKDMPAMDGHTKIGLCVACALLASGGSSFWNSALDTLRGVKKKMGE